MTWNADTLKLAASVGRPIPLPSPAVRKALRQAAGVSRHTLAVFLSCGYSTFVKAETGIRQQSRVLDSVEYRRLLGFWADTLRQSDPTIYDRIMNNDHKDDINAA